MEENWKLPSFSANVPKHAYAKKSRCPSIKKDVLKGVDHGYTARNLIN